MCSMIDAGEFKTITPELTGKKKMKGKMCFPEL